MTSLYYASLYENDEAVIKEVAVYFEYKLLRGNRSLKYSAEFFDAYQSPNYPILGQSGVHLNIEKDLLWKPKGEFELDIYLNEKVIFYRIFPGMNFESLLEFKTPEAIVLQVFGSGTIFNNEKTQNVLQELRIRGIEIVVISQCVSGGISFGKYSNSNIFTTIGGISGKDMTAEAAITKVMHILNNPKYDKSFSELFCENISGEVTEDF